MSKRQTLLKVVYEGKDISEDISGYLKSFSFTDNEGRRADDISIVLEDTNELWIGPWAPMKGDRIEASIIDAGFGTLYCGKFKIDELTASGPPSVFTINAATLRQDDGIRREEKNKAWEDAALSDIATAIATTGGLSLIFDAPADPRFTRVDQRQESDLAFLQRLCEKEGFSLKVSDEKLIVFDQAAYEQKPAVRTLERGVDNIISYNFSTQAYAVFHAAEIKYLDPNTQELITYRFEAPNVERGQVARLTERVGSLEEAQRRVKAELRRRNRKSVEASMTVVGDTTLFAGTNIELVNWGFYTGVYIIEEATHNISNGYTTALKLRKTNGGY